MTELEKLLRDDLASAARDADVSVSLDAIVAEHDRSTGRARAVHWVAAALAVVLLAGAAWVILGSGWLGGPDRAVPNPLQTPVDTAGPTVDASIEPSVEPSIEPSVEPTPEPSVEPSVAPTGAPGPTPGGGEPTASGAPGRTVGVFVYYGGDHMVRELKQVAAGTPARGALEAMLAGPSDPAHQSLWNPGTRVLGIAKHGDVITVDLSGEALPSRLGAGMEGMMLDTLVWTVTEAFDPTDRVLITVDGAPYTSGHFTVDRPLQREPGALLLTVDTPAHAATVDQPVRVTGMAAAFEGTLVWQLFDTGGVGVDRGIAMSDEGMTLSGFSFELPRLAPGSYRLTVTLDDPSGGEAGAPPLVTREFTVR